MLDESAETVEVIVLEVLSVLDVLPTLDVLAVPDALSVFDVLSVFVEADEALLDELKLELVEDNEDSEFVGVEIVADDERVEA